MPSWTNEKVKIEMNVGNRRICINPRKLTSRPTVSSIA